jgi:hypothetical protein
LLISRPSLPLLVLLNNDLRLAIVHKDSAYFFEVFGHSESFATIDPVREIGQGTVAVLLKDAAAPSALSNISNNLICLAGGNAKSHDSFPPQPRRDADLTVG